MSKLTISGLANKRRRLHGELLDIQKVMLKLKSDILALDAALLVMGYNGIPSDLKPIKPCKAMFANRELKKLVAAILRERPDLPTDKLIAIEIISRKGWAEHDLELIADIASKVRVMRRKNFQDGLVKL